MNLNQNLSHHTKVWKDMTRHKSNVWFTLMVELHISKGYTTLYLIGGKGAIYRDDYGEEVVRISELSDWEKEGIIRAIAAFILGFISSQNPSPTNIDRVNGPTFRVDFVPRRSR